MGQALAVAMALVVQNLTPWFPGRPVCAGRRAGWRRTCTVPKRRACRALGQPRSTWSGLGSVWGMLIYVNRLAWRTRHQDTPLCVRRKHGCRRARSLAAATGLDVKIWLKRSSGRPGVADGELGGSALGHPPGLYVPGPGPAESNPGGPWEGRCEKIPRRPVALNMSSRPPKRML